MKSRKLVVLFLMLSLALISRDSVYARRLGFFSRRRQARSVSPQPSVTTRQPTPKSNVGNKGLSSKEAKPSSKASPSSSRFGSVKQSSKPAPVYNYNNLKGSVRAVHIKDPKDSSRSWTVYRRNSQNGPVYEVKNEKTGEVGGGQKIPSKVKVYLLLDDQKSSSWQKDAKGSPNWVEQGKYSRQDMNFYAGYNRNGKENLFLAETSEMANRSADQVIIKQALGLDSQTIDPNRGKIEQLTGEKLLKQAIEDATKARFSETIKDLAAADKMLTRSYNRDQEKALEYLGNEIKASQNKSYTASDPFDQALRETIVLGIVEHNSIASLDKTVRESVVKPVISGFKSLAGYTASELNNLETGFLDFAGKIIHADQLPTRNLISANRYGVAYSEIKNIPHFEAYDKEAWRPVRNIPATYQGEEIVKAYTGRNLVDTKPDSIIAYWGKESGFQGAAVWYYRKNIGPIPDDHFQNQKSFAKLNKPLNSTNSQQPMKKLVEQDRLKDLTEVKLKPKAFDEDSYGGPSAELWQMEQERKQQILSEPKVTAKDIISQYSSFYEGIIKNGGYAKLVKEGRPDYLSKEITRRIHYRILSDYAAKQATLARKQGNWQQWGAWQKEYGKHNFQYNIEYLEEKTNKILSND